MKPPRSRRVIRIINLILSVVWYGALASIVLFIALWLTLPPRILPPMYTIDVNLKTADFAYDILLKDTNKSLIPEPTGWMKRGDYLEGKGEVAIQPPGGGFVFVYNAGMILGVAYLLGALYMLRQLFRALRKEPPFTEANARRVRAIGLFIFFGQFLGSFIGFGLRNFLNSIVTTRGLDIRIDFHPSYQVLFLGLVLIAIAELFRHGVELEEEHTLTV